MAGHSKWAQIKRQKAGADQKRGLLFSKILGAIAAAARENPDPGAHPRLRSLIDSAKANRIPKEKIEAVLERARLSR